MRWTIIALLLLTSDGAAFHRSVLVSNPLSFEPNLGQAPTSAEFYVRAMRAQIRAAGLKVTLGVGATVSMQLVNSSPNPRSSPLELLDRSTDYLVGSEPTSWVRNVPSYARVRYEDVYQGIDLDYHVSDGFLEYDFVVSPGADPSEIRLEFTGANSITERAGGTLELSTPLGTVIQRAPYIYQLGDDGRSKIPGQLVRIGANEFAFKVGKYDPHSELIIDPKLEIDVAAYFGGRAVDIPFDVAFDADGDIWACGRTDATGFPLPGGGAIDGHRGLGDVFVVKIDREPSDDGYSYRLAKTTVIGGIEDDVCLGIQILNNGDVMFAGVTRSPDFPEGKGRLAGMLDVFVGRLRSEKADLTGGVDTRVLQVTAPDTIDYTFLGSEGDDHLNGIAPLVCDVVDTDGLEMCLVNWSRRHSVVNPSTLTLGKSFTLGTQNQISPRSARLNGDGTATIFGFTTRPLAGVRENNPPTVGSTAFMVDVDNLFTSSGLRYRGGFLNTAQLRSASVRDVLHLPGGSTDGPELVLGLIEELGTGQRRTSHLVKINSDRSTETIHSWNDRRPVGLAHDRLGNVIVGVKSNVQTTIFYFERDGEKTFRLSSPDASGVGLPTNASYTRIISDPADGPLVVGFAGPFFQATTLTALQEGFTGGSSDAVMVKLQQGFALSSVDSTFTPNGGNAPPKLNTLFGVNLGPSRSSFTLATLGTDGILPDNLAGIGVHIHRADGTMLRAPILRVNYSRLTYAMPKALDFGEEIEIQVSNGELLSNRLRVELSGPDLTWYSGPDGVVIQDAQTFQIPDAIEWGGVYTLYASSSITTIETNKIPDGGLNPLALNPFVPDGELTLNLHLAGGSISWLKPEILYAGGAPGLLESVSVIVFRMPNETALDDPAIARALGAALSSPPQPESPPGHERITQRIDLRGVNLPNLVGSHADVVMVRLSAEYAPLD